MKKNLISFYIILTVILSGFVGTNFSFAATTGGEQIDQAIDNLNSAQGAYGTLSEIMGIMAWLGFAIAVFKLIQIGINFMLGAGSKRGNAKESLIPWMAGALICMTFGIVGPWIIRLIGGSAGGLFD